MGATSGGDYGEHGATIARPLVGSDLETYGRCGTMKLCSEVKGITMTSTFIETKVYKRPLKKNCLHCGRSAVVKAIRKNNGFRLQVRYCMEHAEIRGAV